MRRKLSELSKKAEPIYDEEAYDKFLSKQNRDPISEDDLKIIKDHILRQFEEKGIPEVKESRSSIVINFPFEGGVRFEIEDKEVAPPYMVVLYIDNQIDLIFRTEDIDLLLDEIDAALPHVFNQIKEYSEENIRDVNTELKPTSEENNGDTNMELNSELKKIAIGSEDFAELITTDAPKAVKIIAAKAKEEKISVLDCYYDMVKTGSLNLTMSQDLAITGEIKTYLQSEDAGMFDFAPKTAEKKIASVPLCSDCQGLLSLSPNLDMEKNACSSCKERIVTARRRDVGEPIVVCTQCDSVYKKADILERSARLGFKLMYECESCGNLIPKK